MHCKNCKSANIIRKIRVNSDGSISDPAYHGSKKLSVAVTPASQVYCDICADCDTIQRVYSIRPKKTATKTSILTTLLSVEDVDRIRTFKEAGRFTDAVDLALELTELSLKEAKEGVNAL